MYLDVCVCEVISLFSRPVHNRSQLTSVDWLQTWKICPSWERGELESFCVRDREGEGERVQWLLSPSLSSFQTLAPTSFLIYILSSSLVFVHVCMWMCVCVCVQLVGHECTSVLNLSFSVPVSLSVSLCTISLSLSFGPFVFRSLVEKRRVLIVISKSAWSLYNITLVQSDWEPILLWSIHIQWVIHRMGECERDREWESERERKEGALNYSEWPW